MSADKRVPPSGPAGSAGGRVTWPLRSGAIPPLADGFVTRPESASSLGKLLTPGSTVALVPARQPGVIVPAGSPDWAAGCGKTQLAVHHAVSLWQSSELDLLVWVHAMNRACIVSGYAAAAAAAVGIEVAGDIEAAAARFIGWLAETSKRWLVVLDDLSAPADLKGLWPAGPAGRTLITTAEPTDTFDRPELVALPMTGLSRREALSFVLGRLTDDRGQRTGAIDLVDLLDGDPLALGQASAVLDNSALSCREYLDRFSRKRAHLALGLPDTPAAAATSWTLCVEQAHLLLPGAPVQPMLVLAAVLDGHWIPGTIFTTGAARDYAGPTARPDDAWTCLVTLERAGMLTLDQASKPPIVRMHPSVQAAVRAAASRETLDRAVLAAADALLEVWPADDQVGWLTDSLRACALGVIQQAGDRIWTGSSYRLLFRAGKSLESAKLAMLAAAHWNHVAAASERFLGADHPDALAAGDHLAAAFLAAGRALEALPWFRRVLADRVGMLGPEDPATVEFEVRVGQALLAAGRADEAIALFERITGNQGPLHGAKHPDALDARDALADAYCAAGRLAQGIRQYRRTLAERERGQGQWHPATMNTCQKLADAYLAADRIKESLSASKRVAAGRERTLGHDHPDTIEARVKLALAYQSAGRMAQAVQLHEQARADSERVLGVDHVDALTRRVHLARAYFTVGRIGDATALLRDTAERCDRVLSPQDPLAQTVRESLANITGT